MNYTHQACIDLILSRPGISQNEIALYFGYTASWISTVMQSDAFQVAFAARREEIVDPILRATLEEQSRGLHARAMEILREKLNCPAAAVPDQLAVQVYAQTSRSLGFGARPQVVVHNHQTVVQELEERGNQLIGLLRRKKGEVLEADDAQGTQGDSGQDGAVRALEAGQADPPCRPASSGDPDGRAEVSPVRPALPGNGTE